MKTIKLQVYDPPMCCSSGVCGPNVDPELVRFSGDLGWLRRQGVEVERYNLSSHPAAFAEQAVVKEALEKEGTGCLPLIVLNGSIVSKGIYPSRSEIMKLSGSDSEKASAEVTPAEVSSGEPGSETAACGPGCDCAAPPKNKTMKIVVCLLAFLTVGGIFIYKTVITRHDPSNAVAAESGSAFAVAPTAPNNAPGVGVNSSTVPAPNPNENTTFPESTPTPENVVAPESTKGGRKIGDDLESLATLNTVALNKDAVFVFIPSLKRKLADDNTNVALLAAQQTLKSNNITAGLYTLPTSSPDYANISAQVRAPAVLVMSKGRGSVAVSAGEVTESILLQAYTASSRASGCGPSGGACGPGASGCN